MTPGGRGEAANTGLHDLAVAELAIDPSRTKTVYAGTGNLYGDGVFKSIDGGRHWRASGLAGYFVEALAIDPRTPTTLYAAIWDPQFANESRNRLARSTDGGPEMRECRSTGLRSITSFAVTPVGLATVLRRNVARRFQEHRRGSPLEKRRSAGSGWRVRCRDRPSHSQHHLRGNDGQWCVRGARTAVGAGPGSARG